MSKKLIREELKTIIDKRNSFYEEVNTIHRKAIDFLNSEKDIKKRKKLFKYLYKKVGNSNIDAFVEYHINKKITEEELNI